MAVSRRCVLAVQGIAVILLTVFVLVFILLVAVLRVSLGNCDDDCSAESSSNVAIVDIDDDDGCNGATTASLCAAAPMSFEQVTRFRAPLPSA